MKIHPLEQWLIDKKFSKKKFCEAHNFSYRTIMSICKSDRRPSWRMAKKIEKATCNQVSSEELLLWDIEENKQ